MNAQTHHWLKYVLIALLVLCLFFFYGNSHADERFASYDIAGKPQTADTTATNTDPDKDTATTATNTDSPSDLTANYAIINPSDVLNAGEVQYFNRRLDNLYKQHQVQTQLLIINKKDEQALADAQQFVKQWQTKETGHRIAQDMSYYTDSQYYFDGIDWALDSVVELLEDDALGLSYEQISDKAEYHFGQLLGFVLVWTLVAIVAILVISQFVNVYLAKWLGHKSSYWLSILLVLILFAGIGYHSWLKMGWYGIIIGMPLVWLLCSKLSSKPLLILNKEELKEIASRRVGSGYGDGGGGGGAGDSW